MATRLGQIERMLQHGAARIVLPDETWDDLLHEWIRLRFSWDIPRVAVCSGHVAPFRFVADMFFQRVRHAIAFASRDSGKTLDLAILFSALMLLVAGIDTTHVGAVQFQAGKCFEYVDAMVGGEPMLARSKQMGGKGKFHLANGSRITLLTGTVAGCQAEHPNFQSFDEARHSTSQVLEEWKSMVESSEQREAQTVVTSTRGAVGDLMDQVLENAAREHRTVFSWCVFEVARQCVEPDCSECEGLLAFDRAGEARSFSSICRGRMRQSRGFMRRRDILDKFVGMAFETFNAQWLCNAPSQIGQYYGYVPAIHSLSTDGRHGTSATDWRPSPRYGHHHGWDFGVAAPNSILIVQPVGEDLVVVDMIEDGDNDTASVTAPNVLKRSKPMGQRREEWGDPDGMARSNVARGTPTIIELAEEHGLDIVPIPKQFNNYTARHKVVEDRLRPRASGPLVGRPRLYVWIETEGGAQFAKNMQTVQRKQRDGIPYGEEPDLTPGTKSHRAFHSCSALEFLLVGLDLCG